MSNKRIYRGPYAGPIEPEIMNSIDRNMNKVNEYYWKYGNRNFPKDFKGSYVNIMMTDPDTGEQIKHTMGPYSKNIAQSIMTDYLAKGECCWVEENWIR